MNVLTILNSKKNTKDIPLHKVTCTKAFLGRPGRPASLFWTVTRPHREYFVPGPTAQTGPKPVQARINWNRHPYKLNSIPGPVNSVRLNLNGDLIVVPDKFTA